MANKHNDIFNKKATNGNFKPKKEKNKPSFYLVIGAIIFCILGSILGSFAFVENRVANAEVNNGDPIVISNYDTVVDYSYNVNHPEIITTNFFLAGINAVYMDLPYNITTGVTKEPVFPYMFYKNVGWAGFDANKGTLMLNQHGDENYDTLYLSYNAIATNKIVPFVTFNDTIIMPRDLSYTIILDCNLIGVANRLESFRFYFLDQNNTPLKSVNLLDLYNPSLIHQQLTFEFVNDYEEDLLLKSYRFEIITSEGSRGPIFQLYSCKISKGGTSFVYDDVYKIGYDNGYVKGEIVGKEEGYNKGKLEGYNKGVEDAGQYTFFSLFSSVVDVPIRAFTDLFNFEIFGQNLTNFFLALVTFAIIIKIIQMLL